MEEGIRQEANATTSQTQNQTQSKNVLGDMADTTFRSIGDVLKLLPTGTVIVYQVLTPIVTNTGDCHVANKVVTPVVLAFCALFCAFSTFTDSYVGADGKVKYGLVTAKGLLLFADNVAEGAREGRDLSRYRLRVGDFVHASFAVVVFAAVALLADANTVACFYPALKEHQKKVVEALPIVVGAVVSVVFLLFPSKRHGIGYPPPKPSAIAQTS